MVIASPLVRRAVRRSRQRGAALFLVVLVMTLLLGIGAFAARSAGFAAAASGSERTMTQARYVAEYGLTFAAAKLSTGAAQNYLALIRNPLSTEVCYGQNVSTMLQRTCYRVLKSDLDNDFTNASYTNGVYVPVTSGQPGSLGMTNMEPDFVVELSDLSEGFTLPGYDLGHGQSLKFWYVTGTASGQVRYRNTGGSSGLDTTSAESSSTQTVRSHILVGPFPSN